MLAAGNTKITDLLSVTPQWIPEGAHAMAQVDRSAQLVRSGGARAEAPLAFDPARRAQGKTIIRITDDADGC